MTTRRQQAMHEMRRERELDRAMRERFEMERHPEHSVDGDNPWERDLFEDDMPDGWQIIERGGS